MRRTYGNGLRATQYRKKGGAKELGKETSQSYQIGALWQQNRDLGIISAPCTELAPSIPQNQIPQGLKILESKREIRIEQRKEAFQVLTRLLQLVTEQKKLYGERLSPHNNFYL